jgi:hypothetical protein
VIGLRDKGNDMAVSAARQDAAEQEA